MDNNKYLEEVLSNQNYFLDFLNNLETNIPRPNKISSVFHQFKSVLNDSDVNELDKKGIVDNFFNFLNNGNFNSEEKQQLDKYILDHIINMDYQNPSYNILHLTDDEQKQELFNSIKREMDRGNMDVIYSMTRHYSELNKKGFSFSKMDFLDNEDIDEYANFDHDIDQKTLENDSKKSLSKISYGDDRFSYFLNQMSNEDISLMLNKFLYISEKYSDEDDINPLYLNNLDTINKEINKDLESNYSEIYTPLSQEQKDSLYKNDITNFSNIMPEGFNNEDSTNINEIDVDIKTDAYQEYLNLLKDKNIVSIKRWNRYESDLTILITDSNGTQHKNKIAKVNNLTGTLSIPPSSFNNPSAHEMAALHARSKGWDTVSILPPKKGSLSSKEEFMKNSIEAMYLKGQYSANEIQVPRKWEKFKHDVINQLKVDSMIKQTLSEEELNYDSDITDEIRLKVTQPEVTPVNKVNDEFVVPTEKINEENIENPVLEENNVEPVEIDLPMQPEMPTPDLSYNIDDEYNQENFYVQDNQPIESKEFNNKPQGTETTFLSADLLDIDPNLEDSYVESNTPENFFAFDTSLVEEKIQDHLDSHKTNIPETNKAQKKDKRKSDFQNKP